MTDMTTDQILAGYDDLFEQLGSTEIRPLLHELVTARKVVVAARSIPIGFDEAGGDATGTIKALDEALSAHDAAELARNKGDAP